MSWKRMFTFEKACCQQILAYCHFIFQRVLTCPFTPVKNQTEMTQPTNVQINQTKKTHTHTSTYILQKKNKHLGRRVSYWKPFHTFRSFTWDLCVLQIIGAYISVSKERIPPRKLTWQCNITIFLIGDTSENVTCFHCHVSCFRGEGGGTFIHPKSNKNGFVPITNSHQRKVLW